MLGQYCPLSLFNQTRTVLQQKKRHTWNLSTGVLLRNCIYPYTCGYIHMYMDIHTYGYTHTNYRKTLHPGSCSMSQCAPQYLHLQMFIATCHLCGSRSPAPGIQPIIELILTIRNTPHPTYHNHSQMIIDLGVGQLRALDPGLGRSWAGQPQALAYLHHQGKLSSIALVRPPNGTISRNQGQLSCSCVLRARSPALRCKASSIVLRNQSSGSTLPSAAAYKGLGQLVGWPF